MAAMRGKLGWRRLALWMAVLALGAIGCSEPAAPTTDYLPYHDMCDRHGGTTDLVCKDICPWNPELQAYLTCLQRDEHGQCLASMLDLVPGCSGGLCACGALDALICRICADGTTHIVAPARRFNDFHVVSVFPAAVDPGKGTSQRVCGAPLPGESAKSANGLEFTVEMVSDDMSVANPACKNDKDVGFAEGERAELIPLSTKVSQGATVTPGMFHLQADCLQPRASSADPPACATGMTDAQLTAATVRYDRASPRCQPDRANTWKNVVILVDHSGSTSGQVKIDTDTCLDATRYAEDLPSATKAPEQFGKCSSDRYYIRVHAAQLLVDQLNSQDRVMTMVFDEVDGVKVGCTDSMRCVRDDGTGEFEVQPGQEDVVCLSDDGCDIKNDFRCQVNLSASFKDSYDQLDPTAAMDKCFGATVEAKAQNRYGIEYRAKYNGDGRAPVYEAVHTAFQFLQAKVAPPDPVTGGNAKHIVLITDGPDTCMPSDDFHFADPSAEFQGSKSGPCRAPCAVSSATFQALRAELAAAKWPVQVHVIQLQSHGHREPNAELMELACRSGGTYQFVNQLELDPFDPDNSYKAIGTAVSGVRHALSGTWRAGFVLPGATGSGAGLPIGQMQALAGELRFENPKFTGLAGIYKPPTGSVGWRPDFQFRTGTDEDPRDYRLMLRAGCATDADCGASDLCAPNHCTPGGVCQPTATPDLLACGDDKVCCGGECASSCPGVCKK
ncbi:MAG: hypothetical protein HY902_04235 [Deltaproteobacteria bacterium]|nr:hypothetical protein [Deltaproteobacteria bacterium]